MKKNDCEVHHPEVHGVQQDHCLAVGNAKFASSGKRGAERCRHGGVQTTKTSHKVRYMYVDADEYLTTGCDVLGNEGNQSS